MTIFFLQRFWLTATMFVVFACGDTLVDDTYRGEVLWSVKGSIQPAPEINAAELTCRFQEVDCLERCSEDFAGFFGDPIDDDEFERCTDRCYEQFEKCQKANAMENFSDVYFGSNEIQRLAIIWANPMRIKNPKVNPGRVIQQRSIVSTGFPARYTVSIYQPPPDEAFFERNGNAFAYGIVVTFYDRNRDEVFDIQTEPIIGFNQVSGVLYVRHAVAGEGASSISGGYHLYELHDCGDSEFLTADPLEATPDSTTLSISGTTMALFDILPDISCDGDQREWLDLCQAPMYGGRCRSTAPPEPLEELCAFCLGQSKTVNPTAAEGPLDVSDDEALEDEDVVSEDGPTFSEDCDVMEPVDARRCEIEQTYRECLADQSTQATLETDCDVAHAQALCELDAESEAERALCGDTSLNESESQDFEDENGD